MQVVRKPGELGRGVDDGLSKAFELTLTPAILGFGGWLLDGRLGLTPLFTLVFVFVGVIGTSLSAWYRYDARMRACEAEVAAARAARPRRHLGARPEPVAGDPAGAGDVDPAELVDR